MLKVSPATREGQSLNRVRDSLSPAAMDRIMTDVGRYQRQLTSIRHDTFGLLGDTLMDDRFRRGGCSPAFLAGFGAPLFTPQQRRRIAWYDLHLYAAMAVECFCRLYDNADDQYRWCLPLIEKAWQDIRRKE